ncbi:MAG: SGNH/GDSL hydrolase family protein [Actinomycetota bacterium]|nr:SGNH/GDSL hydrolase family protein [Actinomycetota bacterium]
MPSCRRPNAGEVKGWLLAVVSVVFMALGFVVGDRLGPGEDSDPLPIDLEPGRYVALGDSYSAGEGLPPWEEGTQDVSRGGDRCHRSQRFAYSLHLAFADETTTQFRACSGAKVQHLYETVQRHGGRPNSQGLQVGPGIPGEDVALVTLTLGGNDVNFSDVLRFCFLQSNCPEREYKDQRTLREYATVSLQALRTDLVPLYRRLRQDFPNARILVLGYPALFPERAPRITRIESAVCNIFFNKWTAPERTAVRDWGTDLNNSIQGATLEASREVEPQSAIEFVDVSSHFSGHEPCTTNGEWVNFIRPSRAKDIRDGSFHPLRVGQYMLARIVSCHLAVFPSADTERTTSTGYAMTGCVARETALVHPQPDVGGDRSDN